MAGCVAASGRGYYAGTIWPDALSRDQVAAVSESEIVAVYPHRSEVPRDVWEHLFSSAEREIGVLVCSGFLLSEDTRVQPIFTSKAGAGRGELGRVARGIDFYDDPDAPAANSLVPSVERARSPGLCEGAWLSA